MNIEILQVGPLATNCYLLEKDGKCLIIDPGAEENTIIKQIKKMGSEVIGILITHDHFDHTTYAKSLSEFYHTKIYDFNNLFEGSTKIGPFKCKVIYTPGHHPTSITFYFEDYGAMFVGDFLFHETIGRVDLPGGSYKEMMKSIDKIKKYKDEINIYPGHGKNTTLEHEKKYNKYLK